MKLLKKLCKLLLIINVFLVLISSNPCYSAQKTIKIALLDNVNDPYLPSDYASLYMQGVKTAADVYQKQGYTIEYKEFFYKNNPLAVFHEVPLVNAWKPDLIIGPHLSNQFLLLKNSFNQIVVISPYASDPAIEKLPGNFYSLALLDKDLGNTIVRFISGEFPNTNLVNVIAADCKDCVDDTNLIVSQYTRYYPSAKVTNNMYTGDPSMVNVQSLVRNYQTGDVIFIQPNTYLESQQLMYRIANYLGNNPIFISNLDNPGDPLKIAKSENYTEYWFTPYLFDNNSPDFQNFSQSYRALYGHAPDNSISYTIYLSIASAVEALKLNSSANSSMSMRENILNSYTQALKSYPHWYKTSTYAVYKITPKQTELVATISALD